MSQEFSLRDLISQSQPETAPLTSSSHSQSQSNVESSDSRRSPKKARKSKKSKKVKNRDESENLDEEETIDVEMDPSHSQSSILGLIDDAPTSQSQSQFAFSQSQPVLPSAIQRDDDDEYENIEKEQLEYMKQSALGGGGDYAIEDAVSSEFITTHSQNAEELERARKHYMENQDRLQKELRQNVDKEIYVRKLYGILKYMIFEEKSISEYNQQRMSLFADDGDHDHNQQENEKRFNSFLFDFENETLHSDMGNTSANNTENYHFSKMLLSSEAYAPSIVRYFKYEYPAHHRLSSNRYHGKVREYINPVELNRLALDEEQRALIKEQHQLEEKQFYEKLAKQIEKEKSDTSGVDSTVKRTRNTLYKKNVLKKSEGTMENDNKGNTITSSSSTHNIDKRPRDGDDIAPDVEKLKEGQRQGDEDEDEDEEEKVGRMEQEDQAWSEKRESLLKMVADIKRSQGWKTDAVLVNHTIDQLKHLLIGSYFSGDYNGAAYIMYKIYQGSFHPTLSRLQAMSAGVDLGGETRRCFFLGSYEEDVELMSTMLLRYLRHVPIYNHQNGKNMTHSGTTNEPIRRYDHSDENANNRYTNRTHQPHVSRNEPNILDAARLNIQDVADKTNFFYKYATLFINKNLTRTDVYSVQRRACSIGLAVELMVLVHCQSRRMSYHHYEQSVKDVQVVPTTKGVTTLGMRFSRQRIALLLQETRNNTNGIRLALTLLKARGHDVAVQGSMDISAATVVLKLLVLVDIMATLFSLHQQHEGDSNNNKNNQRNGNAAGSIQASIFGSLLGQVLVRCPRISRRTPSIPTGNNSRSDNDEENDSTPITAITAEDLHSSPFNAYYLFSALEGCRQNSQAIINRANNLVQLHQLQHEEEEEEEEEEENGKVGSGHKSKKPRNRIDDEKRLTASDVDNLRSLMTLNRTALADLKQSLSSFIHADREVIATDIWLYHCCYLQASQQRKQADIVAKRLRDGGNVTIQKLIDHPGKDGYNVHAHRKDDSDNSSITSSDDDSPHPKGRTRVGVRRGIHGAVPTTSTPLYNKRSHHLHCYASYYTFFYASEGGGAHLGRERESSSDDDASDAEDRTQKRSDVVIQYIKSLVLYNTLPEVAHSIAHRVYDTFDSDSDSTEGNAGGSARMGSDKSSLSSLPSIDSDHQGHTSHSKSATKRGGSADPGGYVAPPQGILAQDPSMTYAALVLYDMDMLSTEYIARIVSNGIERNAPFRGVNRTRYSHPIKVRVTPRAADPSKNAKNHTQVAEMEQKTNGSGHSLAENMERLRKGWKVVQAANNGRLANADMRRKFSAVERESESDGAERDTRERGPGNTAAAHRGGDCDYHYQTIGGTVELQTPEEASAWRVDPQKRRSIPLPHLYRTLTAPPRESQQQKTVDLAALASQPSMFQWYLWRTLANSLPDLPLSRRQGQEWLVTKCSPIFRYLPIELRELILFRDFHLDHRNRADRNARHRKGRKKKRALFEDGHSDDDDDEEEEEEEEGDDDVDVDSTGIDRKMEKERNSNVGQYYPLSVPVGVSGPRSGASAAGGKRKRAQQKQSTSSLSTPSLHPSLLPHVGFIRSHSWWLDSILSATMLGELCEAIFEHQVYSRLLQYEDHAGRHESQRMRDYISLSHAVGIDANSANLRSSTFNTDRQSDMDGNPLSNNIAHKLAAQKAELVTTITASPALSPTLQRCTALLRPEADMPPIFRLSILSSLSNGTNSDTRMNIDANTSVNRSNNVDEKEGTDPGQGVGTSLPPFAFRKSNLSLYSTIKKEMDRIHASSSTSQGAGSAAQGGERPMKNVVNRFDLENIAHISFPHIMLGVGHLQILTYQIYVSVCLHGGNTDNLFTVRGVQILAQHLYACTSIDRRGSHNHNNNDDNNNNGDHGDSGDSDNDPIPQWAAICLVYLKRRGIDIYRCIKVGNVLNGCDVAACRQLLGLAMYECVDELQYNDQKNTNADLHTRTAMQHEEWYKHQEADADEMIRLINCLIGQKFDGLCMDDDDVENFIDVSTVVAPPVMMAVQEGNLSMVLESDY